MPVEFASLRAEFPWPDAPPFPDAPPVYRRITGFDLIEAAIAAQGKPNPLIMEIGSEFGTSTRRFLAIPGAVVISVDPWPDGYGYASFPELTEHIDQPDHMYQLFQSYNWEFRDRLVAVRAYSPAGPKLVYDANLRPDLVYIDGDHHFDAVTRDITVASTLFPDAVIAGDDWRYDRKLRRLEGISFPVQLAVKRWAATNDVHVISKDNQRVLDPSKPFNLDRPRPAFGLKSDELIRRIQAIEDHQLELVRGQRRIANSRASCRVGGCCAVSERL